MKRQHMMWCAAALIAGGVTVLALGAPASAVVLVLLGLVMLACLVMMFMMSGGHGHSTDRNPYPFELNRIPLMMRGADRVVTLIGEVASAKRDDGLLAGSAALLPLTTALDPLRPTGSARWLRAVKPSEDMKCRMLGHV